MRVRCAYLVLSEESGCGISASICSRSQLTWEVIRQLMMYGSYTTREGAITPAQRQQHSLGGHGHLGHGQAVHSQLGRAPRERTEGVVGFRYE